MRSLYPLPVLALLLASCNSEPLPESGVTTANSSYHQALLVMLDCRNQFTTAMRTLSQSAPHLPAQQRLEVLSNAAFDRIECERKIDPILNELRTQSTP